MFTKENKTGEARCLGAVNFLTAVIRRWKLEK